jgi:N-acetylglucosamine malate deacetylase 2
VSRTLVSTFIALLLCATPSTVAAASLKEGDGLKTFLMVVAHPDDENIIGGFLARLAREGHTVRLIIATDGKYAPLATSIPEGELLGAARRKESQCAAQALGITPPIFLAIDRLDTKSGVRSYLNGRKRFLELLSAQLSTLQPDVLVTFGPDGEYGHPEHIVASAAVTEILLRDGLVDKYPLYYIAWQREQVLDDDSLSFVDPRYLGTVATFSDEDEMRSFEAAKCYKTQFTQEQIENQIAVASRAENRVYFRRFRADEVGPDAAREEL